MNSSINLKEIARILNVSISTVSKSINNSPEISPQTKQRVVELAKQYNYTPNHIATSLKNRKTNTIGVIVPDILNYFFVKAVHAIVKVAKENGIKVITCISNENSESEIENVSMLANGSVDGLIISLSKETQQLENYAHIDRLIQNKMPVVLFDRVSESISCEKIVSDDFLGAYEAVSYLIDSGSQNIGLVAINTDLSVVKLRVNGYTKAMNDVGIITENKSLFLSDFKNSETHIAAFLKANAFDGIFCVDERLSVKVLKVAFQLGYKIPQHFKVIGFSNGELSEEFYPSLSVVDLHAKTIGRTAAVTLIEAMASKVLTVNKTTTIPSTLVHRGSTVA